MRIIAGKWGGRRITAPSGQDTRPTGDRMRESLFSSLHSRIGSFESLRVLDGFAGSGALGLEALSRGAAFLASVESNPKTCRIIEDNYMNLQGISHSSDINPEQFRLCRGDIFKLSPRLQNLAVDIAFFDPPYDLSADKMHDLLQQLAETKVFAYGALIIIERAKTVQSEDLLPSSFTELDTKTKGSTTLHFARFDAQLNV
ncbi:MAG: 16S rRNA (guanine(966)-N(2))-methyltransferase RsmD [Coriobacteriia bacterium]|nr:16S rRNA (guanine(966)-N(2))-methyltransferase RsmD [Coriobacteriia bacterium]